MSTTEENARYCADLASGLADAGVSLVFVSPGSRNTPITLALAADPRITDISIRDERSAAFAAVGYAKATGRPAGVVCTSGSAAAHYFPAIVEANQSAAPLIVLTADRPARLRGTAAPQMMDQIDLYGSHAKVFADLPVGASTGREDAHALVAAALEPPSGPVHANAAFEEPLVSEAAIAPGDPGAWVMPEPPFAAGSDAFKELVGRRVLIVAGGRQRAGFVDSVNTVAERLGAPVISDPQCWVTGPRTVANADLLVSASDSFIEHAPEVIIRLGALPTSKKLWTWMERSEIPQILIDLSRLTDPLGSATTIYEADPTAFLKANAPISGIDTSFLEPWLAADAAAQRAVEAAIGDLPFPNEPEIARTTIAMAAPGTIVYVGSSMPIRDVDTFAEPRTDVTVLANRGVNGIDGAISTALGASLSGTPVTLLVGDVAALHDATALAEAALLAAPLRIVVVNNNGGGIFSFLPQGSPSNVDPDTFERHWGTPHDLQISRIAESLGVQSTVVDTLDGFMAAMAPAISGPTLIELRTERSDNVRHHRAIREAVSDSLRRIEP